MGFGGPFTQTGHTYWVTKGEGSSSSYSHPSLDPAVS